MALLTLSNAQLAFGHVALLDHADFSLDGRERVGLIGRNGSGKSSLLRIISGQSQLDDGSLVLQQGIKVFLVEQEPKLDPQRTVFEAVAAALGEVPQMLREHAQLANELQGKDDGAALERMHAIQSRLDAADGWRLEGRIGAALSRLNLPPDALIGELSGGTVKRVALAAALVAEPDVLLLDEPTNHLDFAAIEWLEALLRDFSGSVLLITHDRRFLDTVATRIVELDRGRLLSFPGNFAAYQKRKSEQLANEMVENAKFDKFLAQEEVWIRKGVQARRTRDEGRVRRLEQLRRLRSERRERQGKVKLDISTAERSGKIVCELTQVCKAYSPGNFVVRDFSATIMRGDRVGIIGPNGAGKTTLLRMILGLEAPDSGSVRRGARLETAYFDQLRVQLDENAGLADTISPGSEWVEIGGDRKHVMSYLGDFLFSPERARSPVKSLSGGERNRLLLARLFAQPSNVLVLDEPTNDLDIETLELLEDLLSTYQGTVLLVSHDRNFLDNVVTQVIAAEGNGVWKEYVGGYGDWERVRPSAMPARGGESASADVPKRAASPDPESKRDPAKSRKLSYKQQRELDELPGKIAALEQEQQSIAQRLADADIYKTDPREAQRLAQRSTEIETLLMQALERWEEMEGLTSGRPS